jgi:exonuclease III
LEPSRGVLRVGRKVQRIQFNHPPQRIGEFVEAGFSITGGEHEPAAHPRYTLLLAGDIETNPGPACACCAKTLRAGVSVWRCVVCDSIMHGKCTGLSRRKLETSTQLEAADCPRCKGQQNVVIQHAESAPQHPVCIFCKVQIRRDIVPLQCGCCENVSHKKCAGRPRGGGADWTCIACVNGVQQQQDTNSTEGTAPTPTGKCPQCKKRLRKITTSLTCCECKRTYHKTCSHMPRTATEVMMKNGSWKCKDCNDAKTDRGDNLTAAAIAKMSRKMIRPRVLQWNCDGINTKMAELAVVANRADIVLVQETKLTVNDNTPQLEEYNTARQDRHGSGTTLARGGGLIAFIRKGLHYKAEMVRSSRFVEIQRITIWRGRKRTWSIYNVYLPPVREDRATAEAEVVRSALHSIELTPDVLVCGDFNAHSERWDHKAGRNERAELIEDWMDRHEMTTLNDGSATRFTRDDRSVNCSTPDLTICRVSHMERYEWEALHMLSSDHLPILVQWTTRIPHNGRKNRIICNRRNIN